jgi:hypothetical protein
MVHMGAGRNWGNTSAELVIRRDDLDPATVTTRLALEPTSSRLPGPDRWRPGGDSSGVWSFECHDAVLSLPEQMELVLDVAEPRIDELVSLRDEGFDVALTVFGFIGNGAVLELSSAIVQRLAAVGLPLELAVNTNAR